jgi:hypothetical protein
VSTVAAVAPTIAPTPTPPSTPKASATPSPAPSPTVLGEAQAPDGGSVTTYDPSGIAGARVKGPRPEIVQSVIIPSRISDDMDVIGTNAILAGVTLITILITATVFNQTVQENSDAIEGFFGASWRRSGQSVTH